MAGQVRRIYIQTQGEKVLKQAVINHTAAILSLETMVNNLRTVVNELKTDVNATLTKLDADSGVGDTNYSATNGISSTVPAASALNVDSVK